MACLFGHKWEGCKCTKCGKLRDSNHSFSPQEGGCEEKCQICGKVRENHDFVNGFCSKCGQQAKNPVVLEALNMDERFDLTNALECYEYYCMKSERDLKDSLSYGNEANSFPAIFARHGTFDGARKDMMPFEALLSLVSKTKSVFFDYSFTAEEAELILYVIPIMRKAYEKEEINGENVFDKHIKTLRAVASKLDQALTAYREEAARRSQ